LELRSARDASHTSSTSQARAESTASHVEKKVGKMTFAGNAFSHGNPQVPLSVEEKSVMGPKI